MVRIVKNTKDKVWLKYAIEGMIYVERRGNVWVVFDESGNNIHEEPRKNDAVMYAKKYIANKKG